MPRATVWSSAPSPRVRDRSCSTWSSFAAGTAGWSARGARSRPRVSSCARRFTGRSTRCSTSSCRRRRSTSFRATRPRSRASRGRETTLGSRSGSSDGDAPRPPPDPGCTRRAGAATAGAPPRRAHRPSPAPRLPGTRARPARARLPARAAAARALRLPVRHGGPPVRRYRLRGFGHGFVHVALATGAPIVPVAVIGAEEEAPLIANPAWLARLVRTPVAPITPTIVFPLPVKYRLHFGAPIHLKGSGGPEMVARQAQHVRAVLQDLIDRGLAARHHVFF